MSVNKYNSTTGNLERLDGYTVDSTPTSGSGNPVSSGGVFAALAKTLPIFDEDYVTTQCGKNSKNCLEPGIYYLPSGTESAATSTEQTLFVIQVNKANNSKEIHQIFYLGGTYPIYKRYRDTSNTWHQWFELNFTQSQ
jgi:hypothetical protein